MVKRLGGPKGFTTTKIAGKVRNKTLRDLTGRAAVIESGMAYTYTEHISDIGIEARGETLEAAFEAGAEATLNIMFDLETIEEREQIPIIAEAGDIELLFVEVLNEVLSLQGLNNLALRRLGKSEIRKKDGGFAFSGVAHGERFDAGRHGVRTEVKGATYSGLSYNNGEGGAHQLSCVLDV